MIVRSDKKALLQARPLVGDLRQIASVRRIVLDDGPKRGVSALAFSTGGGLDFWVLVDRAMDIGPLWHRGTPMAWQSPAGFRHPALVDVEGDGGHGFGRGFSGFLMKAKRASRSRAAPRRDSSYPDASCAVFSSSPSQS